MYSLLEDRGCVWELPKQTKWTLSPKRVKIVADLALALIFRGRVRDN
jgi:hypothetical protein